jgi:hypothetical protein
LRDEDNDDDDHVVSPGVGAAVRASAVLLLLFHRLGAVVAGV